MKFVMMSDTHYLSRRTIANENRKLLCEPAVTEQALRQAADEKDCDAIIISGDLTDLGDRYSHEDFVEILREIKKKKKVYVIFATHDFHHHRAFVDKPGTDVKYPSKPWEMPYFDPEKAEGSLPELVDAVSPEEIFEMYREFGPDDAYSVRACDFSYCIDLDENTRCLMLNDIFRNEEALHDNSASFTPGCFRWIKQMKDEADRDGKFIFAVSHHPFIPAVPAHRLKASPRNLRTPYTGHLLADMGINLAFTGHTHCIDTGFCRSDKGNLLCDIASPSVRFYPPMYRTVDLDGKNGRVSYDCVEVKKPEGTSIPDSNLFDYYARDMYDEYIVPLKSKDNFTGRLLRKLTLGKVMFLARSGKLTKKEKAAIGNKNFADFVMELVYNMMRGDGSYFPGTPEYKFARGFAAAADSIVNAVPFYDIRRKMLQGYSVWELLEPMLYPLSLSNMKDDFDFTVEAPKKFDTSPAKSHAGAVVMVIAFILTVILCPLLPPAAIVAFISGTINKKRALKKNPPKPLMRY